MSKLNNARERLAKAREISDSSTSFFRQYNDRVREEYAGIGSNRELSDHGRFLQREELRQKRGSEFMKLAHERKKAYLAELEAVKKDAEAVVYAIAPKPDVGKVARFEAALRSMRTELMFAKDQRHAHEKLADFVRTIDDPHFAGMVREQFGEISSQILSLPGAEIPLEGFGADPLRRPIKTVLGEMYRRLNDDFESAEVREARGLLDTATAMTQDPRLFNDLVVRTANDTLGVAYGAFLNSPETYFEKQEGAN